MDHISVCVCTYRRPEQLARLLETLTEQRRDDSYSFEIVVVDNDNRRSAEPVVKQFSAAAGVDVRYDCEPEQNIALTRNRAVRAAKGNLIAFIDDDETAEPQWLGELYRTLKGHEVQGALGPVVPDFPDDAPSWLKRARVYNRRRLPTGSRISPEDARTGNVLLYRSNFVGDGDWFDPAFGLTGGEDSDFFQRRFERGCAFVWSDEAVAHELVPPSRWSASFHLKRYLRSGTLDGERIRSGLMNSDGLVLRSAVILGGCVAVSPVLLFVPKHLSMKVLLKLAYCCGIVAAYAGVSLLRNRE